VSGFDGGSTILVVAAHPDDEVIGMGGTIARHTASGDRVHVLFLSDGVGSRQGPDAAARVKRLDGAARACELLGSEMLQVGDLPDNQFDTVPLLDAARLVERHKAAVQHELVYTHHPSDLNVDHRVACQATVTAFRPQPGETFGNIFFFEVSSSTEWAAGSAPFMPDTFVDVTDHLEAAQQAYACYGDEARPDPHARSAAAVAIRAQHRGRQVGMMAAEAFETHRRLVR
jgi:N-acetylglucosamine malate deacetylase 1